MLSNPGDIDFYQLHITRMLIYIDIGKWLTVDVYRNIKQTVIRYQ